MSTIDNIPVRQQTPAAEPAGKRSNPLAHVFDELVNFCRSRSMFMLHYCTGCGAIELPPAMTSRFDMERLGIQPMVTPRQADILLDHRLCLHQNPEARHPDLRADAGAEIRDRYLFLHRQRRHVLAELRHRQDAQGVYAGGCLYRRLHAQAGSGHQRAARADG